MEKQLLKLDVLSPLPLSLDMRNGNRQIRELREHTVYLEACQLFPVRLFTSIRDLPCNQMGKK